jgi:hypothetical protein
MLTGELRPKRKITLRRVSFPLRWERACPEHREIEGEAGNEVPVLYLRPAKKGAVAPEIRTKYVSENFA